jgi:hypothetical protein
MALILDCLHHGKYYYIFSRKEMKMPFFLVPAPCHSSVICTWPWPSWALIDRRGWRNVKLTLREEVNVIGVHRIGRVLTTREQEGSKQQPSKHLRWTRHDMSSTSCSLMLEMHAHCSWLSWNSLCIVQWIKGNKKLNYCRGSACVCNPPWSNKISLLTESSSSPQDTFMINLTDLNFFCPNWPKIQALGVFRRFNPDLQATPAWSRFGVAQT